MDKYRVAKLIQWAKTLRTRKRLQKVVYLLNAADCPFDAEFNLHHYGPYSHELAQLTDEMVRADLLVEQAEPNPMGGQTYSYQLSERAADQVKSVEDNPHRSEDLKRFEEFSSLADRLLKESVSRLEYAATVAYFKRQDRSWDEARECAAKFKRLPSDGVDMRDAERLAREVMETNG